MEERALHEFEYQLLLSVRLILNHIVVLEVFHLCEISVNFIALTFYLQDRFKFDVKVYLLQFTSLQSRGQIFELSNSFRPNGLCVFGKLMFFYPASHFI